MPATVRTQRSVVAPRLTTANKAIPLLPKATPAWPPSNTALFYAVKVRPGSFGTFAGLKTNGHAQVVDRSGAAITGLYAVGTDMASVMGGYYPSGGINLGPAMTFGYIAGLHAAAASSNAQDVA